MLAKLQKNNHRKLSKKFNFLGFCTFFSFPKITDLLVFFFVTYRSLIF